jgi:hypothetical protein
MKKLCVVVPVHKPVLLGDEEVSLAACAKHLKNYDCFLLYPEGMKTDEYQRLHKSLILMPVSRFWLSSIENYNKMKVDVNFYEMFSNYEFMLTYELDSYIFNSNLADHYSFEYDYIGAPFFEGYISPSQEASFIKGGNSGFSVRRIKSCIHVLRSIKKFRREWLIYKIFLRRLPSKLYHGLVYRINLYTKGKYDTFLRGDLSFYFEGTHLNEDGVWSQVVPALFPFFRVADPITALQFSFEACPERLLELNKGNLPLGCHGWAKNKQFWTKYIHQ